MKIPEHGMDRDALFERMESYRKDDLPYRSGKTWGYVYDAGREAEEVGKKAFTMFMSENALDPTVYPSLLRFEREVVAMAREHLRGGPEAAGNFTSGGTESIMLAVKSARDWARQHRPEIERPQMVLPITAHAAFHKAAAYLGVEVVVVPVDAETCKADVARVRDAITDSTVLLVGSAPSYAHGVVDPIVELGALAKERGLLLHVDACIGGFLLPYLRRLGEPVPDFDLSVPGVTSISMDLHKYAYAPKGASVVLYRDRSLRKHQIFACSRWTGYTVVNTTVQSTKSGGPLAGAWAVLSFLGDDGYLEIARGLRDATRALVKGIEAIDGLYLLGRPEMSLLAFTSDEINVFELCDDMKTRGWYIQPQLGREGHRENVHLSVNPSNVRWVEPFLEDLAKSVEAMRDRPENAAAHGLTEALSGIDPAQLDAAMLGQMLQMVGIQDYSLPEKMADVNEVLNALPPALSERLLTEFVNELFV